MAPPQKRKRSDHDRTNDRSNKHLRSQPSTSNAVDTSRPSAVYKPTNGRSYTVSVAVADSVISNALTHDLKTALAGTIARSLAVFCIDELIVFSDGSPAPTTHTQRTTSTHDADVAAGYSAYADPSSFLCHVASYLETPPHLRKALIGFHPDLRTVGVLPSLDLPSHLRADEWCRYREGVRVLAPHGKKGSYVNVGLPAPVEVTNASKGGIRRDMRVTLKFAEDEPPRSWDGLQAEVVAPEVPREEGGYYWGYSARKAEGLTEVFTESTFEGGYDFSIGMSERGKPLEELLESVRRGGDDAEETVGNDGQSQAPPKDWQHLLVVFGGPPGLERAVRNDRTLKEKGVTEANELFDAWINLMDGQGSRTIRTEEAVWIGLMGCWEIVKAREVINKD